MPDQHFAADLDSMRRGVGLSLRELVRSTGIPRSTLSDALAGRRTPRLETVLAVARACGGDTDLWRHRWAATNTQAAPVVPAQLPRDIGGFTSREHEIARLGQGGLAVIHGRPGVGKTALAVHWAHSIASQYPDGQLFLDVRGHHPTLSPMAPAEAMGRLLGAIGVEWAPLAQDPYEGEGLWRSSLAGRRLLIVIDDAISADQVRPLVPSAPGSCMIVTSRHYLADLIVRDGADGIVLDGLPPGSSLDLLSHVAGTDRVAAEPAAAATVAAACGHLPLALRLAGAVLAAAPERSFADLADALAAGDRLTALEGLARPSAVEHAFELSYRVLPEDARLLFRRLGLHPGPDISVPVAALLGDLSPETASSLLRLLAEAHLIEPGRFGRYRMHDLLRDYAARLVQEADEEAGREKARRRLFDWYVDRALAVSARLEKGRERLWADTTLASAWEPGEEAAAAWVASENRNVVAVIEYDARRGTGRHAWSLIDLLSSVLSRHTDITGLIVAVDAGIEAARHGERHAEGAMRVRRGWLRWRAGRREAAAQDFDRALRLAREVGARRTEASSLRGLSTIHADAGRLDEARECAGQARAIYRAEGDRNSEATALTSLAVATYRAADFGATLAYLGAALALHRETSSRGHIALALANLAQAHCVCGNLTAAFGYAEEAVGVARAIGDGFTEAIALSNGAQALNHAGRAQEAYRWAKAGSARARDMSNRLNEAITLDDLATASRALGRSDAGTHRSRAAAWAREAGDLVTEAEILVRVARDAYQDAACSAAPAREGLFTAARVAATRALEACVATHARHGQAQALGLIAACDLALGEIAGALVTAQRAVAMHHTSGARLAEVTARLVLAFALTRHGDAAEAEAELGTARQMLEDQAVPETAPAWRLLAAWPDAAFPPLT